MLYQYNYYRITSEFWNLLNKIYYSDQYSCQDIMSNPHHPPEGVMITSVDIMRQTHDLPYISMTLLTHNALLPLGFPHIYVKGTPVDIC